MDITPIGSDRAQHISRYGDGGFVICGHDYHGSVIVTFERTVSWSLIDLSAGIAEAALADVKENLAGCEILLIGSGKRMLLLPPTVRQSLKSCVASVDVMDTGAACRTYNILMSEGRKVVAALMAI